MEAGAVRARRGGEDLARKGGEHQSLCCLFLLHDDFSCRIDLIVWCVSEFVQAMPSHKDPVQLVHMVFSQTVSWQCVAVCQTVSWRAFASCTSGCYAVIGLSRVCCLHGMTMYVWHSLSLFLCSGPLPTLLEWAAV